MCGNFSALKERRLQKKLLEKGLDIDVEIAAALEDLQSGTLFPSSYGWILDRSHALRPARWGLVPAWSADPKMARHTFNARSETMREKPAFRDAFRNGRCLVPAEGWWEWDREKRKTFVKRADGLQFWFAGLECGGTFSIVTQDSCAELSALHHRQPVLLDPDKARTWLNPGSELDKAQAVCDSASCPAVELLPEPLKGALQLGFDL